MPQQLVDIECSIGELFDAIALLEGVEFVDDEEYFQQETVQVDTPAGYSDVVGLIRKFCHVVSIECSDGSILECADRHILFDDAGAQVFAGSLVVGSQICTRSGLVRVVGISDRGSQDVYDFEVDNYEHTYYTADGILHHNTSITAAISHTYSSAGYKTITIVPSGDLVDQTASWYKKLGIDTGIYSGDEKDIDHLNVVATWQALQYNPSVLLEFSAIIWDECHGCKSTVAQKLLNEHGAHAPFRFGVTGTFPKPECDQMSLFSSVGPILIEIPTSWLMKHRHLSSVDIYPVELNETYIDEEFPDYAAERAFVSKSATRMETIANLIISQCGQFGNTLVLVNSIKFGEQLASLIDGAVFLYGESPKDLRKEHYEMFERHDDMIVIASSGIASTGISIDRIFCLVLVDSGKSFVKAIQSIGRSLRKGHDKESAIVFDVHSKLKWSRKHAKERIKYYKDAQYTVHETQKLKIKK